MCNTMHQKRTLPKVNKLGFPRAAIDIVFNSDRNGPQTARICQYEMGQFWLEIRSQEDSVDPDFAYSPNSPFDPALPSVITTKEYIRIHAIRPTDPDELRFFNEFLAAGH